MESWGGRELVLSSQDDEGGEQIVDLAATAAPEQSLLEQVWLLADLADEGEAAQQSQTIVESTQRELRAHRPS